MTLIMPTQDGTDEDESLAVTEKLLEQAGVALGQLLSRARMEDEDAVAPMKVAVKDLSERWKLAVTERNRVADERKKSAGIVGTYALDLGAARDEIERRMACLRAARED